MRTEYDETDYIELTSEERFLAAVDAYRHGCCTMAQMLPMAFDGPPFLPENLSALAFAHLVFRVAHELIAGSLVITPELKEKYAHF